MLTWSAVFLQLSGLRKAAKVVSKGGRSNVLVENPDGVAKKARRLKKIAWAGIIVSWVCLLAPGGNCPSPPCLRSVPPPSAPSWPSPLFTSIRDRLCPRLTDGNIASSRNRHLLYAGSSSTPSNMNRTLTSRAQVTGRLAGCSLRSSRFRPFWHTLSCVRPAWRTRACTPCS